MKNFDLQPTLRGEKVYLRPIASEDFEALYTVASDPLIWEQHPENTRYQQDVFTKFFQGALDSKGAFIVHDKQTNEIIGSSRYSQLDLEKKQVEVGYTFIARKYWGRGHNKEMKRLMLSYAFQFVEQVLFYIGEHNYRSRKAVEKIGGQFQEKFAKKSPRIASLETHTGREQITTLAEPTQWTVIYSISKANFLSGPLTQKPFHFPDQNPELRQC